MKIGYARVSTQEQNLSLQIDALNQAGCEQIYQEKVSGSLADRPELTRLLEMIRVGDTLVIWKLDRLGRSLAHLIGLVSDLEARQIGLLSLNDPVDTTTPQGRLVFRIFASLAEFEREVIRERTMAGLASARRRGQRLGRPKGLSKAGSADRPDCRKPVQRKAVLGGADCPGAEYFQDHPLQIPPPAGSSD